MVGRSSSFGNRNFELTFGVGVACLDVGVARFEAVSDGVLDVVLTDLRDNDGELTDSDKGSLDTHLGACTSFSNLAPVFLPLSMLRDNRDFELKSSPSEPYILDRLEMLRLEPASDSDWLSDKPVI